VSVERFKSRFRSLEEDPDESHYRKALVDLTRAYCVDSSAAAD
jgi:hypothetical protein